EVRLGFAMYLPLSLHHHRIRSDADSLQGGVDDRPVAGGSNGVGNPSVAQGAEHFDGAGQWPGAWHKLAEDFSVPPVDGLRLARRQWATGLALGVADDERPARPDVAVQPVTVHGHPRLAECALPGEHVGVNGIYERAIQVEEQRVHGASLPRGMDEVPKL